MPKAKKPSVELRALPTFEHLPEGHATFWVTGDGCAPHLNIGEFAVVDTTDRKPQHGELYLKQGDNGRRERSIVQTKRDRMVQSEDGEPLWALHQLRGFRRAGELDSGIPLFTGTCDGHYPTEWLEDRLLGRVVGVSTAPLGNLLDPAAGYLDEDAENAEFDEREYVNVLTAAGYEVVAVRRRPGGFTWWQKEPERRLTPAQEVIVFDQMRKRNAASQADDRIAAECVRRGLIG